MSQIVIIVMKDVCAINSKLLHDLLIPKYTKLKKAYFRKVIYLSSMQISMIYYQAFPESLIIVPRKLIKVFPKFFVYQTKVCGFLQVIFDGINFCSSFVMFSGLSCKQLCKTRLKSFSTLKEITALKLARLVLFCKMPYNINKLYALRTLNKLLENT